MMQGRPFLLGEGTDVSRSTPEGFRLYKCAGGRLKSDADAIGSLAFAPDGATLAWSKALTGPVVFWDTAAGKKRKELHP
jgi:hypothetical protein